MNKQAHNNIPLAKLLDLKIDFAFKQLFGSERNKHLTIVFLNAILQSSSREPIKDVTFINQEVGGEYKDNKQSRFDIVVKTQNAELINIEIQLANKKDMLKRTLFYWSRLYNLQLQKGKGYHTLNPTITINICNFTLFHEIAHYHSMYHLYEDKTLQRVPKSDDVLEIHFIEMDKFLKAWTNEEHQSFKNILERWLLMFGMIDDGKKIVREDIYKALEEIAMTDENIRKAFQAWEEISQDPENIIAYQSRVKYMLDEAAKIEDAKYYAEQEGIEKGIEKGIKQGIEGIAKKMILKGNSNEEIMELTNLKLEEVQSIRQEVE